VSAATAESEAQRSGFGLWLAGQFRDLVRVRAFRDHSVVRLHRLRQIENASAVGAAVP
jgi:hypothetical protein